MLSRVSISRVSLFSRWYSSQRVVRKILTPEQEKKEKEEEKLLADLKSPSRIKRWGAIARSEDFNKRMLKWYILGYGIFMVFGIRYFQKEYLKEQERTQLVEKKEKMGQLSEWENLRLRQLSRDMIRTSDLRKLQAYHRLEKNWEGQFDPQPHDIEKKVNENIVPARDLTDFYNGFAKNYDSEIGMEETLSFIGGKRKWLMKQIEGDVLEVASGTGRNIKYLDLPKIRSITFLDTSSEMMDITREKFRKKYPDFGKVGFVVGRAEDLPALAKDGDSQVKYDTIIETFGLCSHQDPVQALDNFGRLLKPGGRVILLEHGIGSYDFINSQLDRRAKKHSETWGCRWNLDIGELVDKSELEIVQEKRHHFGTTWCIVAKKPGDPKKVEEIGIFEKYFSSGKKADQA